MNKLITFLFFLVSTLVITAQETVHRNFALKFTPTQLVSGEFSFGYEQRLAKFVSLELNVGPTLSEMGLNRSNHTLWKNNADAVDYTSGLGFHVSLEPRLYLFYGENEMRGLYLSAYLKYRVYNTVYSYVDKEDHNGSLTQLVYRFNMGYQFWPGARNFCLELFAGFGFAQTTDKYFGYVYTYNENTQLYESSWKEYKKSQPILNGVVGMKIGFGR